MNKIIFLVLIILVILIILFLGYIFIFNKYPYNYWACIDGGYKKHGFPLGNMPIGGCGWINGPNGEKLPI